MIFQGRKASYLQTFERIFYAHTGKLVFILGPSK